MNPTTSYCPNCGRDVDESDRYCGQCGHDLTGSSRADRSHQQFRARVSDHLANGWAVQYDGGDEVALVNRTYGSVPVHILLLLFTGGVGNLLYGWYHYEHTAERKVLRAHGEDSRPGQPARTAATGGKNRDTDDQDGTVSGYAKGLLSVALGIAILTSFGTSPVGITLAVTCLILATLLLPPTRRRIENRHPPTTFGPTTTVDEQFVRNTDKPCSVCFDRVDRGLKREYEQSYVVAGVPLYTIERGENWYCEECRTARVGETDTLDAELAAMDEQTAPGVSGATEGPTQDTDEESTLTEDT
ncbi:zinc-ribbon domain-containing protein [Halovenus aranensis]|jgi:hypothetical protein|uniref:Zinc-ribbon domain-containing protein n=1 Tax=Halovenus aranensis TaxID=890420 RepID=A0A1G8XI43_9EURY|nr:zinc ribbon domain-containing protein [Halovenus aranensis]SDJ90269.1 zinc-ribbon domain-containing protein [Halovenus aranensis]